jgi:hypothetical protein
VKRGAGVQAAGKRNTNFLAGWKMLKNVRHSLILKDEFGESAIQVSPLV